MIVLIQNVRITIAVVKGSCSMDGYLCSSKMMITEKEKKV